MAITAAAGPMSNLVLAVGCAVTLGLVLRWSPGALTQMSGFGALLTHGIQLNVALALFNLLPIPPLDGSRIVARFIPARLQDTWEALGRVAPLILVGLFVFGSARFLSGPMGAVTSALWSFVTQIARG